jgi:hypothetical protein
VRSYSSVALGFLALVTGGACGYDGRNPSVARPEPATTDVELANDTAASGVMGAASPADSEAGPEATELALSGPSLALEPGLEQMNPPAPPEMMEPVEPTPPRPTCSEAEPFASPTRVPGRPNRAVRLRTSPDERVGYYALPTATSSYDLLVSTRDTARGAFGEGGSLPFNDAAWDFSPTLPSDGTIVYLESNRSGSWKLYQSEWDAEAEAFGPLAFPPGLSSATQTYSDGGPSVSPDGAAIYFHTNRQGRQLLATARRNGADFGPVVLIDSGDVPNPGTPVVSSDELTLYFAVEAGTEAEGRHIDIWSASRSSTSQPFTGFREVSGVNTSANEVPSFISEDGCRLYFDRNTGFPFGWGRADDAAYFAERQPEE